MRIPLEYGDNFPVPTGRWNPSVPWRFPRQESLYSKRGWFARILPWMTLGIGMTLGILWMNWHAELPVIPASGPSGVEEPVISHPDLKSSTPVHRSGRLRSRLA